MADIISHPAKARTYRPLISVFDADLEILDDVEADLAAIDAEQCGTEAEYVERRLDELGVDAVADAYGWRVDLAVQEPEELPEALLASIAEHNLLTAYVQRGGRVTRPVRTAQHRAERRDAAEKLRTVRPIPALFQRLISANTAECAA